MIFDLGAILAFVSSFLTLEPGDVIATGTPAGVGPMQPGDEVSIEIEGLASLTNTVIKG
jgi:2-keto-4-pentenoate hydratase/2-oxohepta-3-ene-1,7-dioic acid hydratase in catechol pathway